MHNLEIPGETPGFRLKGINHRPQSPAPQQGHPGTLGSTTSVLPHPYRLPSPFCQPLKRRLYPLVIFPLLALLFRVK